MFRIIDVGFYFLEKCYVSFSCSNARAYFLFLLIKGESFLTIIISSIYRPSFFVCFSSIRDGTNLYTCPYGISYLAPQAPVPTVSRKPAPAAALTGLGPFRARLPPSLFLQGAKNLQELGLEPKTSWLTSHYANHHATGTSRFVPSLSFLIILSFVFSVFCFFFIFLFSFLFVSLFLI